MKKILISTAGFLFIAASAFAQNLSMGVSVQGLYFDADGQEVLKESGKRTSKSEDGVVSIASIFIEGEIPSGQTIGIEVVPYGAKLADGSMTNDDDEETTGTNKVDVDAENMITLYVEAPVGGSGHFVKGAVSQVSITTSEVLNTGATYGDEDINGFTLGFGKKTDLQSGNGFFKVVGEISHFEGASFNGSTGSKIDLDDFQTAAIRLSVGKQF